MGIAFFEALRRHAGAEQEEIFQQENIPYSKNAMPIERPLLLFCGSLLETFHAARFIECAILSRIERMRFA